MNANAANATSCAPQSPPGDCGAIHKYDVSFILQIVASEDNIDCGYICQHKVIDRTIL